jgi:hypothetical protein
MKVMQYVNPEPSKTVSGGWKCVVCHNRYPTWTEARDCAVADHKRRDEDRLRTVGYPVEVSYRGQWIRGHVEAVKDKYVQVSYVWGPKFKPWLPVNSPRLRHPERYET